MRTFLVLGLLSAVSTSVYAQDWAATTKADLMWMHDSLAEGHPGAVPGEDPAFVKWLEEGYVSARKMLPQVTTLEGHDFVLRYYANGFHDGHLRFQPQTPGKMKAPEQRWPGFTVSLKGDKPVVYELAGAHDKFPELPALGSELVSCDGKSIQELLENVYSYRGNPELEAGRRQTVPYLFVDEGNPFVSRPSRCVFRGAEEKTISLAWVAQSREKLQPRLERAGSVWAPEQGLREFRPGHFWVSLPTFGPDAAGEKALKRIIAKVAALKRAKLVVFDVRGNSGGSSEWGSQLLKSLYGAKYYSYIMRRAFPRSSEVDWRASQGNIEHTKGMLQYIQGSFGKSSEISRQYVALIKGMEQSLAAGKPFYRTSTPTSLEMGKSSAAVASPVRAQVVFLTDSRCFSACLDFADEILAIPGVTHVGLTTDADTVYMELRVAEVPSRLGNLAYPKKVYRNRIRKSYQAYTPKFAYPGDISDTPELERWVLKTVAAGP